MSKTPDPTFLEVLFMTWMRQYAHPNVFLYIFLILLFIYCLNSCDVKRKKLTRKPELGILRNKNRKVTG